MKIDSTAMETGADGKSGDIKEFSSLNFFQIDAQSGVRYLGYQIPILESLTRQGKKTEKTKLLCNVSKTGIISIKKGLKALTQRQSHWIGTYPLVEQAEKINMHVSNKIEEDSIFKTYAAAKVLSKLGKPGLAADTLAKVITRTTFLTPTTLPIANDLGFFLVEAKRPLEGAEVLETVIAADSNRTVAYLNLGDAYAGAGKTEEARQNYRKYRDRMEKAGKAAKIPPRIKLVLEK